MPALLASRCNACCRVTAHQAFAGRFRHTKRVTRRVTANAATIEFNGLELALPDIDGDVKSYQLEMGAEVNAAGVAQTFGQRAEVLTAVDSGVALMDRSHWGRLKVAGQDALTLLQRICVGDCLDGLRPGQGADVEFGSGSGRIGAALALVQERGVLLVVQPATTQRLKDRLDVAKLPEDKAMVMDIGSQCCMFSLIGPKSADVLRKLGAANIVDEPHGSHCVLKMKEKPVVMVVGAGLPATGYTIIPDESIAGDLYAALANEGCALMGEEEWDLLQNRNSDSTSTSQQGTAAPSSEQVSGSRHHRVFLASVEPAAASGAESSSRLDHESTDPTPKTSKTSEITKPSSTGDAAVQQSAAEGAAEPRDGEEEKQGPRVNKWKLIVDRAMLPTRKARVVDIEQIQRHGNPSLRR